MPGVVAGDLFSHSPLSIEDIHPFADGNGRTGRALALWELYRRGFDTHHIFSVDEVYGEDCPAYYAALANVRKQGNDLTEWIEYSACPTGDSRSSLDTHSASWSKRRTEEGDAAPATRAVTAACSRTAGR